MHCSRRGRRRPLFLLLTACAALVVLLAACGSSGEPTSYDDKVEPDGIPTVEENFMDGCEVAAKADPAISPAAKQYCACAWDRVRKEISFEDFKKLDDDVRDDPEKIRGDSDDEDSTGAGPALTAIMADCRTQYSRS